MFLGKCVLKTCTKFTGEHPCQSVISINLKIILQYGCFPVSLLHIFRTPFLKNTSGRLLLYIICRERWTQICAVPLANQLRAVTDTFRPLAQQNIRQINFTKVKVLLLLVKAENIYRNAAKMPWIQWKQSLAIEQFLETLFFAITICTRFITDVIWINSKVVKAKNKS